MMRWLRVRDLVDGKDKGTSSVNNESKTSESDISILD